jgi:hypothetical protein
MGSWSIGTRVIFFFNNKTWWYNWSMMVERILEGTFLDPGNQAVVWILLM